MGDCLQRGNSKLLFLVGDQRLLTLNNPVGFQLIHLNQGKNSIQTVDEASRSEVKCAD